MVCPACASQNSQSDPLDSVPHILLNCDAYRDLKPVDFDPLDDGMPADFFCKVVQRRIENGKD